MLFRSFSCIRLFSRNFLVQNRLNINKTLINSSSTRFYSQARLSKQEIESRIIDIVKGFDKITDPSKITPTSSFSADLGLDSLDTVEVVMAIEEAFNIEIPDKEADEIRTIGEAITYISNHPDAC
ncbi:acyl carrier protein [Pneumocystis carinii B80]|uniref:Acyl carrier protein n=1 Tax=Pneumocystis carinii (strain B80) TaxID=1408658 RepID=A0A0W4ZH72_PNEC8|nr:acyl carrier protein [Pneumocystis carinii B80]KTW27709.1 acyl carrier protein [Pneumocystis carinii B80]